MCCFGSQDPKGQKRYLGTQRYITNIPEQQQLVETCGGGHDHQDTEGNTKIGEHEAKADWCRRVMPEKFAKRLLRVCKKSRNQQGVDVFGVRTTQEAQG